MLGDKYISDEDDDDRLNLDLDKFNKMSNIELQQEVIEIQIQTKQMDQPETLMIEISKNNLDFYNDYLVALGQKKRIVVRRDLESKESE